jgi:hypothetical protein
VSNCVSLESIVTVFAFVFSFVRGKNVNVDGGVGDWW